MTHRFTITITLAEPTALTEGSSDAGGGHTTLPYIPGTSILGAFVGALGIEPNTPLFASAFLSGSTRFLNAYPGSGSTRTLPRPLTYKMGKLSKSRAYDAIAEDGCDIPLETIRAHFSGAKPCDTLKSTRLAMIAPHEPGVDCTPERIEQVHVGLDRSTRAAADGVLFTYEAVRGGSVFIGAIETEDAEVAAILRKHAACELRLGRSRGAGYGRALAAIAPADGWREYERMQRSKPARAIVTLLADYLPHLECAPIGALRNELAIAAGVSTDCIQVRAAALRKVRGFRGIWGLPRPARTALAKGSTLVIDADTDAGKLADALSRGIGARTNEGFGRVAVDWTVHGKKRDGGTATTRGASVKLMRPKLAAGDVAKSPAVTAIAARRSDRLMHEFVTTVLESDRAVAAAKALVRVPPSQLGNLRAAVSGSMRGPEICDWFKSICEKTAGERWKRVKVPSLLEDQPVRAGHAFVWQSLLGGKVDDHDRLDESAIGSDDLKRLLAALSKSAGGVPDATITAAQNRASDTVRLIIAGLVSNTARLRCQKVEGES